MTSLSQVNDAERVKQLFVEAMNDELSPAKIDFQETPLALSPEVIPLQTLKKSLGTLVIETETPLAEEDLHLLRTASNLLAVLLENLAQKKRLQSHRDLLWELAADPILVADKETGILLNVNRAAEELTGRTAEELIGASIATLHPRQDAERYRNIFFGHAGEGGGMARECEVIRSNGSRVPVEINARVAEIDEREVLIGVFRSVTERKQAEEQIERLARFPSENPNPVMRISSQGVIEYANAAASALLPAFTKGSTNQLAEKWQTRMSSVFSDGTHVREEIESEGRIFQVSFAPVPDHGYANVYALDVTDHHRLEAHLRQAQKLESIGTLAGGVAHDFNNLLMGIMSYVDMCRDDIEPSHPINEWLDEVTKATKRSADLTRQLLAFARQQTIEPVVLDLNDTVSGMLKMLRLLIGEDIDLTWKPGPLLWPVKLDPSQIDQILANLIVNARDAISGTGKITIATEHTTIDEHYASENADAEPGQYVMLSVSDDGKGMEQDLLDRIFEPFFTTKEVGRGTGLGLATVYGIVRQNKGFLDVSSRPGQGTTFRIYLPLLIEELLANPDDDDFQTIVGGDETIMLVEDEKAILDTTRIFLEGIGYSVLAADSPAAALDLAEVHEDGIDLLITDVIMPGMSGRDMADKLAADRPDMKVLYMSGYTASVIANRGVLIEGMNFLSKPFTRTVLAQKTREILNS
ncbi:MAG: ATP-binding protein [Kiritimatiellia bacterium]|nr:ATP-binding protein [Kiritimatiellia bacterium]